MRNTCSRNLESTHYSPSLVSFLLNSWGKLSALRGGLCHPLPREKTCMEAGFPEESAGPEPSRVTLASYWPGARLLLLSHQIVYDSFGTPWTIAHQTPLSMGFSRQEYWSGLPCPLPPGDLPDPGIKPTTPALQADSLPTEPPGKPQCNIIQC